MKTSTFCKSVLAIVTVFSMTSLFADSSMAYRTPVGGERPVGGAYAHPVQGGAIAHPQAAQDVRAYQRGENNGAANSGNGAQLVPATPYVPPSTTPGPLPPPNNPYPQGH